MEAWDNIISYGSTRLANVCRAKKDISFKLKNMKKKQKRNIHPQ